MMTPQNAMGVLTKVTVPARTHRDHSHQEHIGLIWSHHTYTGLNWRIAMETALERTLRR